ncbi:hypothetical protein A1O1_04733 [Capronia coronata CBS 617.96]|uniref:Uncharacterized protein n=1 Tax=Capronia coronata CBS 617.96 TaxID=1182541 RepID=W9YEW8_9EURO|nr:uncharacterized protein A1O1_04733 [Capronia coronata CBS 617.96]EXJ87806.1 hypothetical protein A1O1_04733 [Capronia coronata CBS 617.96]
MDTSMSPANEIEDNERIEGDGDEAAADGAESVASSSDLTEDGGTEEDLLEEFEATLNKLTLDAETIVAAQPRATQLHLTTQTKKIFKDYKQYGSMARLKIGVEKLLAPSPDEEKLCFSGPGKDKTSGRHELELKGGRPGHYGRAFATNYTKDDDEYESYGEIPCPGDVVDNPLFPDLKPHLHPLRIIDPECIPYVTNLPWNPVATTLSWPAGLQWPKGLLGKLNTILSIVDHECRVRLFHHVSRYGPSPVFRAGIEQQVQSHYSTIFQTARQHYLGFTPETRAFLRSVYESKKRLNRAEKRLLAQVCRVAEGSIDIFWEDLNEARMGFTAMKVFVMARELEKAQEARNLSTDKPKASL